jgi:hypothetical protein
VWIGLDQSLRGKITMPPAVSEMLDNPLSWTIMAETRPTVGLQGSDRRQFKFFRRRITTLGD